MSGSNYILMAGLVRNLHRDLCPLAVEDHKPQDERGREWESRQYKGTMLRAGCGLLQDLQDVRPGGWDQRRQDLGRA